MIFTLPFDPWSVHTLIFQVKGDLSGIPVMLVGNKSDEESGKHEVSEKTGQALQVSIYYI